jgi:hypothetical protein
VIRVHLSSVGDVNAVLNQRRQLVHRIARRKHLRVGRRPIQEPPHLVKRHTRRRCSRRVRVGKRRVRQTHTVRHDGLARVEAVRAARVGPTGALGLGLHAVGTGKRRGSGAHVEVKDGDLVGVRRGVDGRLHATSRRHLSEEKLRNAKDRERRLSDWAMAR